MRRSGGQTTSSPRSRDESGGIELEALVIAAALVLTVGGIVALIRGQALLAVVQIGGVALGLATFYGYHYWPRGRRGA